MNEPDFAISAGLRARQLVIHVMSGADVEEVGDAVSVTDRQIRSGLPNRPEQGRRRTDVAIEKQTIAVTKSRGTSLNDQPRTGGVEHDG